MVALVWVLMPGSVHAEAALSPGRQSNAAQVRITVLVPPLLQLVRNDHPAHLEAVGDGRWQGVQHLSFRSNLAQGTCIELRQRLPHAPRWGVQTLAGPVRLEGDGEGYRVCSVGPGVVSVTLLHVFEVSPAQAQPTQWPVMVSASSY